MKYLVILTLLLLAQTVLGQQPIVISEGVSTFSTGSQNTLSFVVNNASVSDVTKGWQDVLKGWKCKPKGTQEWVAKECMAKNMGERTFYVYSIIEDVAGQGVRLRAAFDLGGAHLTSAAHPEQFKAAEKILYDLAVEQTKVAVRAEVAAAQKILSDRQAELVALQNTERKLESDIQEYQKKIEDSKIGIGASRQAQTTKLSEIDAQRAVVRGIEEKLKAIK
jgi:hypothetical protein